MSAPQRIHLSRRKGWQIPPNTVLVARPSAWGNPYKVGPDQDAAQCVEKFRVYMLARPEWCAAAIIELKGRNLGCWCRIGDPCHADVLLELANRKPEGGP